MDSITPEYIPFNMALYTQKDKTTVWLSLQNNNLPSDIINVIWKNVLEQKKLDFLDSSPPILKKKSQGISKRTQMMMDRWLMNGRWNRHVRNVQYEEINPIFLVYN